MLEKISASALARKLKIPFSRLYNALSILEEKPTEGLNEEDIKSVVVELQQAAIPFNALVTLFNENTTLEELCSMEAKLVNKKYKDLWDKRSKPPKRNEKYADFFGVD